MKILAIFIFLDTQLCLLTQGDTWSLSDIPLPVQYPGNFFQAVS